MKIFCGDVSVQPWRARHRWQTCQQLISWLDGLVLKWFKQADQVKQINNRSLDWLSWLLASFIVLFKLFLWIMAYPLSPPTPSLSFCIYLLNSLQMCPSVLNSITNDEWDVIEDSLASWLGGDDWETNRGLITLVKTPNFSPADSAITYLQVYN